MITKPANVRNFYNVDSDIDGNKKQVATSSREIVSILVTAGGGAIAARIYDSANGPLSSSKSILIAANQGESTPYCPSQPIAFKKGIYVDIEQGGTGQGGGEVLITFN